MHTPHSLCAPWPLKGVTCLDRREGCSLDHVTADDNKRCMTASTAERFLVWRKPEGEGRAARAFRNSPQSNWRQPPCARVSTFTTEVFPCPPRRTAWRAWNLPRTSPSTIPMCLPSLTPSQVIFSLLSSSLTYVQLLVQDIFRPDLPVGISCNLTFNDTSVTGVHRILWRCSSVSYNRNEINMF